MFSVSLRISSSVKSFVNISTVSADSNLGGCVLISSPSSDSISERSESITNQLQGEKLNKNLKKSEVETGTDQKQKIINRRSEAEDQKQVRDR